MLGIYKFNTKGIRYLNVHDINDFHPEWQFIIKNNLQKRVRLILKEDTGLGSGRFKLLKNEYFAKEFLELKGGEDIYWGFNELELDEELTNNYVDIILKETEF